ncbi:MAG: SCO family protein [Bacteroidetes bacterium]|nr:MAG: SCO family protein [Bacteroidota bacterium]
MSGLRLTVALCLGFIAVVVGLFVYSVTRTPLVSEEALREQGVVLLPRPRELEPFSLTTHTGEPFTLDDLRGRWTFVFFGFTHCPDICPTTMSELGKARRRLQEDDAFQGVLVTVDPERDTPELLAEYVTAFAPDFLGVYGSREAIAQLATQVNATFAKVPAMGADGRPDPSTYLVDHSANVVIINPYGHYHGFIKYPQQADTIAAAFQTLSAHF